MKVTSKIDLINKNNPEKKIYTFNRGKREVKTQINYDIKIGEELTILGESLYCHKDGFFFIVKCKNGEVILLDSDKTDIQFEHLI